MKRLILFLAKIKLFLKDSRILLFISFFWFLGGFLVYFFMLKFNFKEALASAFFFKKIEHDFSNAYTMWSQGIIFGIIFSFLMQNIMEKHNPQRSCRMIAKEMKGHIVVIGYSHLGQRLVSYFIEKKIPYCLIEKDKERIDELLRQGEAVVVDDAKENDALHDANLMNAKMVIIASNNLETALIVTKRARQLNKDCQIITRCFQDEFAEILESLGADEVISSSKNAFEDIAKKIKD
jgi:hypothetical protein